LPSHAGSGLKLAVHRTCGPGLAPDATRPPIDEPALLALAHERLRAARITLRSTERCLYTMTADQGFRITTRGRTTTVLACSGHGFKFGPVVGQDAANAVLAALQR
jgi:sarcosine oxidase